MFEIPEMKIQESNFVLSRWDRKIHQQTHTKTQHHLWPSAEDFYHPWNPTFGFYFTTTQHMEIYPMLLLRDGAEGISDFFLRFPIYKKSFSKLAVHADLWFLIPESWRTHTVLYRMKPHRNFLKTTEKIVIYALTSESFLSWSLLQPTLEEWISTTIPQSSTVGVYFSQREELYDTSHRERTAGQELLRSLQHHLDSKVNLLNLQSLKLSGDDCNTTFIHLDLWKNSVALCSIDSYMQSRACQIFPIHTYQSKQETPIASKRISLNHEITLYKNDNDLSHFPQIQSSVTKLYGEKELSLPLLNEVLITNTSR